VLGNGDELRVNANFQDGKEHLVEGLVSSLIVCHKHTPTIDTSEVNECTIVAIHENAPFTHVCQVLALVLREAKKEQESYKYLMLEHLRKFVQGCPDTLSLALKCTEVVLPLLSVSYGITSDDEDKAEDRFVAKRQDASSSERKQPASPGVTREMIQDRACTLLACIFEPEAGEPRIASALQIPPEQAHQLLREFTGLIDASSWKVVAFEILFRQL
jgi:hypothetical protein